MVLSILLGFGYTGEPGDPDPAESKSGCPGPRAARDVIPLLLEVLEGSLIGRTDQVRLSFAVLVVSHDVLQVNGIYAVFGTDLRA
jgi:hypothetical protein